MQHSFDIEIATQYDVATAIFLNNLAFWIKKNMANNKHFHDGRYWTYNSIEAYSSLFPYWSIKQIRLLVDNSETKHGLILRGNYNKVQYDRTSWYSLTDKSCKLLNISILPTGQMEVPERANRFARKGKPIPDALPALKPLKERSHPVDKFKNERQMQNPGEPKCILKFYEAGNPDYDRVHGGQK